MKPEEAVETLERIIDYVKSHPFDVYYQWEEALRYAIHCCKVVERIDEEKIKDLLFEMLTGEGLSNRVIIQIAQAIHKAIVGGE